MIILDRDSLISFTIILVFLTALIFNRDVGATPLNAEVHVDSVSQCPIIGHNLDF